MISKYFVGNVATLWARCIGVSCTIRRAKPKAGIGLASMLYITNIRT